ncbi:hypothetical protein ZWY2020_010310 [Hordeum vulgare]|nr:hypothetical protein ZWY2020_010310 [Hordeum vulgare]
MSYISGARSLPDEQVRIASTKMDGIGPKKMNELTKYQIDQIEQMIAQDHVVHWELKRGETADIERLISISLSWNSSSRWIALTRSTNSY